MKNKKRCHFLRFCSLFALLIIGFAISACKDHPEPSVPPSLTGTVGINGTAHVGQTLTADTDYLKGNGVISYQWKRWGTGGAAAINIGANSGTYMVQAADLDSTITVTVTRAGYSGSVSSGSTSTVILPPFPGTVTISGNVWVGQTLTANTVFLDDSGGVSYQWKRNWTDIIGTDRTYVVQTADVDSIITVTVTRSGYSGGFTSEPTDVVTLPPLSGTVTIDGIAEVGQTLTANTANLGGTGPISYQWKRGTAVIGVNRTYEIRSADLGYTLTVTVTRSGYSSGVSSKPTDVVILPALSGTVSISGTPQAGQTLTANTTSLGGTGTISYQWKRGTGNIGTNSSTYAVQTADVGSTITVTVTRSGNSGSKTSNPTATVTPAPPSGQRTYGESVVKVEFTGATATVTFNNLSNHDIYLVKVNTSSSSASSGSTGSVQSVSPSFSSDDGGSSPVPFDNERPRMGHPAADALRANPPPIERETIRPRADIIPPRPAIIGDTKSFYVETSFDSGVFIQKQATLRATGTYSNIWVIDNLITVAQAQALSNNFDIMYPAETNILGYEFGGGPGGNGGRDSDPKIQILVYNIGGSVLGFFWAKDYYEYMSGSNKAEIFYINSSYINRSELLYLTLAHEFQHMINWNRKYVQNGKTSDDWYDETLSMMTEDMMANILGIPTTHADHPIRDHIPYFIESYTDVGFSEWDVPSGAYPYSKGYAFGAYLMRNYGGADLLRRILANNSVDTASITAALNEIEPGMTFAKAVSRFGEAMIFSGNSLPTGAHTFDKTVTSNVTGNNGTHSYTLPAFNIWNTRRYSSSNLGPIVYSLAPRTMRAHTVLVQQDASWKNRMGSITITLNRPSNDNVEMYLMVR